MEIGARLEIGGAGEKADEVVIVEMRSIKEARMVLISF